MDKPRLIVTILVLMGVLCAYSNSLQGEFIFDDSGAITGNPYITRLWPLTDVFKAPRRTTNSGRPIACLSLALNYQIAGYNVAGYRAVNVIIHLSCMLLIIGLVRRLLNAVDSEIDRTWIWIVAVVVGVFWALHPVNTVLVNYIAQRCELLSNFFILLTLYCSVRGFQSPTKTTRWFMAAVLACILGAGCKEVAVVAPILVLLIQRAFFGRNIVEAIKSAWLLYVGFAFAWSFAAWLVSMGGTAEGANSTQVKWGSWIYLISQSESILLYLKLIFFPVSLCFDYGAQPAKDLSSVISSFVIISVLGIVSLALVVVRPAAGFCLAWFFLLLAPSSSVVPLPDITVEYRMSLAMVGIIALVVWSYSRWIATKLPKSISLVIVGILGVLLVFGTYRRNADYHSALQIWSDAARKQPGNARAYANAGVALAQRGDLISAEKVLRRAVELDPNLPSVQMNYAAFLAMQGKVREALPYFERAAEITPDSAQVVFNLGNAYSDLGQSDLALLAYRQAVALDPNFHDAHLNLGIELFGRKEFPAALEEFQWASRIMPDSSNAHLMRGRALLALNQKKEARLAFEEALKYDPKNNNAAHELRRLAQ